jgi:hypothetical protein
LRQDFFNKTVNELLSRVGPLVAQPEGSLLRVQFLFDKKGVSVFLNAKWLLNAGPCAREHSGLLFRTL